MLTHTDAGKENVPFVDLQHFYFRSSHQINTLLCKLARKQQFRLDRRVEREKIAEKRVQYVGKVWHNGGTAERSGFDTGSRDRPIICRDRTLSKWWRRERPS